MFHAGRPYQDSETRGAKRRSLGEAPGEWQRMWSGREGGQSDAAACSLSDTYGGPDHGDRGTSCGPKTALIAGPARFDCSPLQIRPTIIQAKVLRWRRSIPFRCWPSTRSRVSYLDNVTLGKSSLINSLYGKRPGRLRTLPQSALSLPR